MISIAISEQMKELGLFVTLEIGPISTKEEAHKMMEGIKAIIEKVNPEPPTLGVSVDDSAQLQDKAMK